MLRQFTRDVSESLFRKGLTGWRWVSWEDNDRNWTALWKVKWTPGVELRGALNEQGVRALGSRAVMWYELEETPGTFFGNIHLVIDDTHMQPPERLKLVRAVNCIQETLEGDRRQKAQELYAHATEFLNQYNRHEIFLIQLDLVNNRPHFVGMAADLVCDTHGLFDLCLL